MFPSLRFMLAAVLSTLVILVIASSALISTRRLDMPMVLHPVGSRPLLANWLNDNTQSFEARFGPQAMLINASLQLPPKDPVTDRSRSTRIEFVASANAAIDPTPPVGMKTAEKPVPVEAATTPTLPVNEPLNVAPAVATAPSEPLASTPVAAEPPPEHTASLPTVTKAEPAKIDPPIIVAAITPAPVPAKDPQAASDAPAQPGQRVAVALPAAPATERPAFVDTSRTEPIAKPAKKRAQLKRPKRRVVVRPAAPAAKPAAQTTANPFAALFGSVNTH